jgi:hypothetical protein
VKKLLVGIVIVALGAGAGYADEVTDQIDLAKELYQEGLYSEAVEELNFAVAQIQQLQMEQLQKAFPEPLDGWEAQPVEGAGGGMAFFGGGMGLRREYSDSTSDQRVEIQFLANSPLIQSIAMFVQNPALIASQPGSKLIRICRTKAVLKFSEEDQEGEVSFILSGSTLVQVSGRQMEDPEVLVSYAEAIRTDIIEDVLGK